MVSGMIHILCQAAMRYTRLRCRLYFCGETSPEFPVRFDPAANYESVIERFIQRLLGLESKRSPIIVVFIRCLVWPIVDRVVPVVLSEWDSPLDTRDNILIRLDWI